MHMFCLPCSIVPPCECSRRSLIWGCWIVLFAVRKGWVRASFVVWGHRRNVSALCLFYKIYNRINHPMNEYLNYFAATRNTRASAALSE